MLGKEGVRVRLVSKKYERGLFFERFLNYLWCKFHINNFSIVSVTRASFEWEFGGFFYSTLPSQNFLVPSLLVMRCAAKMIWWLS